jgi:hypothetical protein
MLYPHRIPTSSVLAFALLASSACKDDGSPDETTPPSAEASAEEAADTPTPQGAAGQKTGTLTLGDDSYAFTVRVCDTSGDADGDLQTLYGVGETAEGETFRVYASRNKVGDMLSHSVSLQLGDVARGEGTVLEANRVNHGGTWTGAAGPASGPLIEIDGGRITARGSFRPADGGLAEGIEGVLEATCR